MGGSRSMCRPRSSRCVAAAADRLGGCRRGPGDARRLPPPAARRAGRRPARAGRAGAAGARGSHHPDTRGQAGGRARVVPTQVGEVSVPEPIGRALAATADAGGRAAIVGWPPGSPGEVRVEAQGLGVQLVRVPQDGANAVTVTLAPVGQVEGRLVAPGNVPVAGVTIRATSLAGGHSGSGARGIATAACDEQGRFQIPAIAAGKVDLKLEFVPARDIPLRGADREGLDVKAGQVVEVAIPLRETMRVRGVVREGVTKRPIPRVKVSLNGYSGGDTFAMTDAEGRYAGRILRDRNQPFGWPLRFPSPFYEPSDMTYPSQRMPRPGVVELELSPLELRRGVDVPGTVAGEDGRPVAGAEVEAFWYGSQGQVQAALARSDRSGGFVLHGIDRIAELHLTAWDGHGASGVVKARAEAAAERPIALTLRTGETIPLRGQVVDGGGRPVAGAEVVLRRQVRAQTGRIVLNEPVAAGDGSIVLRTGADGRFHARGRYPACCEYYAEARAPGRIAARSTGIAVAHGQERSVVLVLRQLRAIEGRVVDRRGAADRRRRRPPGRRRADADPGHHRRRRPIPPARRHRGPGADRRREGRLPDRAQGDRRRHTAGRGGARAGRRAARRRLPFDRVHPARRRGEGTRPPTDRAPGRQGPGAGRRRGQVPLPRRCGRDRPARHDRVARRGQVHRPRICRFSPADAGRIARP